MSKAMPLSRRPKVELERLARRRGIKGWERMTKAALVAALTRAMGAGSSASRVTVKSAAKVTKPTTRGQGVQARRSTRSSRPAERRSTASARSPASKAESRAVNGCPNVAEKATSSEPTGASSRGETKTVKKKAADQRATVAPASVGETKPTTARPGSTPVTTPLARPSTPPAKDRVILTVNDPYWLHVMWELSAQSVQRAEAALKQDWYGAKLTIRLWDVTSQDTTSTYETPLQDIPVEEDGHNWYIHVSQPPRTYRVDIGYMSRRGEFFVLARSNVVTTPKAGTPEALDIGWETDPRKAERIAAMSTGFESATHPQLKAIFEERLRRPIGSPRESGFGSGATPPQHLKKFFFDLDAKLIVFGRTDPQAHLTLGNDPVELRPDGTFVMEFSLPDTRQIIPAVAVSADGVEERTIVLAVERNTKYLEPIIHDQVGES